MFRDLLDQLGEEWVSGSRYHESVVDAGGVSSGCQEWEPEHRIQLFTTGDVYVEVDATVVVQQKVAEDVGPLNCLAVFDVWLVHFRLVVERVLLLRIVFAHPISCVNFRPELVLPVRVQTDTAIACGLVLLEPGRTIAVTEAVLVQENLVNYLGREVIRGRGAFISSIWRLPRVVGKMWVYRSKLDVRASALEKVADMQERMISPAAPEGEPRSDGEDQEGSADVAKLHVDLLAMGNLDGSMLGMKIWNATGR